MSNPKISVILPVYNGEKFMHRCVANILAQTFTDFELIIIDDGSKDNTGQICDECADKDKRIKVLHKQNGGVSSARNLGLDKAIGEWIAFVDCDDTITDTYLENLMQNGIPTSCMVLALYSNVGKERHLNAGLYSGEKMVRHIIDNNILALSGPYAKLYNRNVINANSVRFPIGVHMGEDGIFIVRYLNVVDNLLVVDKTDYWVNVTEGSLSSRYNDFESESLGFDLWYQEISKFVNRYNGIFKDSYKVVWNSPAADLFLRCMHCSYMRPNLSMSERIGIFKKIRVEYYDNYVKYGMRLVHGKRDKLQYFLLSHKLYFLYVVFGLLMKKYSK